MDANQAVVVMGQTGNLCVASLLVGVLERDFCLLACEPLVALNLGRDQLFVGV